jgi:hypothetical protein
MQRVKNYKIKFRVYYALLIIIFIFFFSQSVFAGDYDFIKQSGLNATAEKTGHKNLFLFNSPENLPETVGMIIAVALLLLGIIFLILMIYGGYMWMTAGGDEQKVEKAKGLIRNAIIGLVIVLAAYAITAFMENIAWLI